MPMEGNGRQGLYFFLTILGLDLSHKPQATSHNAQPPPRPPKRYAETDLERFEEIK